MKEGSDLFFINTPKNYLDLLGALPSTSKVLKKPAGEIDFIHFFTKSHKELLNELPKLKKHLKKDGMMWISWPKKSSKVKTDITEDLIRNAALDIGLVDVKVCAIDEIWSGLKLVYRLKDR